MEISAEDIVRMKEYPGGIKDTRRQGGHILHRLVDILVIGPSAVLCGWSEFGQMEELGRMKLDFFKRFLELPHWIPDAYTFNRAFRWVQPEQLLGALQAWLEGRYEEAGRRVNIDGKTIRGSKGKGKEAVHLVSAWFGAGHVVLGQVATGEKSNEITAIPELLDQLEVAGDTVTIDAMGCQREIAEKIREKGANYVLSVKENQPQTYQEIKEYFDLVEEGGEKCPPEDVWRSGRGKKNHGRIQGQRI
jgi:predicted transposase YbfD/YdcC